MMCKVRNPSRRGGWRSRERGAVGRRAAVRGVNDALDQVVSKDCNWIIRCLVLSAWWTLILVGFCFSRTALAAPSIEIDGNFAGYENNETYNGYVVVDAPNENIATLTLIGEYSSLVQIDSDMYVQLSNESSGGRFYQLVQEWQVMGTNASGTAGNYPTWAGSTYFIDGLNTVYGYGHVWECAITDALKAGAKEDFLTIIGGGSLGGGGGDGGIPPSELGDSVNLYWQGIGPYSPDYYPATITLDISAVSAQLKANYSSYDKIYFVGSYYNNALQSILIYGLPDTLDITLNTALGLNNNSSETVSYKSNNFYFSYTNESATLTRIRSNLSGSVQGNTTKAFGTYDSYLSSVLNGSGGGNDEPGDNNWPDDETPQPPAPNPPTPTTPDPDPGPTLPPIDPHDPVIPSPPTNEPAPTGTTPTDYTPWLQAILQQLVNLTSYLETCFTWLGTVLDNHCQHIRDHMTTCFNWLGEYEITGMSNLLSEHHTFLNGLAQWIVDNIKWENSGGEFDDSNMIYWLRRIYARQGAGDVNSRPVDPATDYSGFSGWLGVLYDAMALDVSDTSLTALTSSLSGLQHTFPFSLPWDVKQVLQALDVSPVTPAASIPSGTSGVSYNVDLHWMDSAMVSVRAFELLVFIVYVMVHTKDLFGYLMGE